MIGTLINHVGAERVTREELRSIPAPPATDTWKPIPHSELVDTLEAELYRRTLKIRNESYAVQRDGALLFGVIDLYWMETEEFAAAIGLRTANDKTMSLQMAVGLRVFVCDNLAFSGDLIALRRKHTSGLDLAHELAAALDRYQEGVAHLYQEVARLKDALISDEQAKVIMFDAFQHAVMPVRFFHDVHKAYFEPDEGEEVPAPRSVWAGYYSQHEGTNPHTPRTLWTLHNAFTRHIQRMAPGPAFAATARLGKLFGLGHPRSLDAA